VQHRAPVKQERAGMDNIARRMAQRPDQLTQCGRRGNGRWARRAQTQGFPDIRLHSSHTAPGTGVGRRGEAERSGQDHADGLGLEASDLIRVGGVIGDQDIDGLQ
jgi:hypothetical protein